METSYFGKNVKALRDAHKMTQQDLAEAVDMSVTTISLWETQGKKPRQKETIEALCSVFGVGESDLFGFSDGYYAKSYGMSGLIYEPVPSDSSAPVLGSIAAGDPSAATQMTGEKHFVDPRV